MRLAEQLEHFAGALAIATTRAPDEYPDWSYITYESNMADLRELWANIRQRLKRDADKVPFIDQKLQEAFSAFDAGEKEKGRDAIWALYNMDVKKLR